MKKKTKTPHCRNSFKIQYQNRKKSLKIPKGGNQNPYIEDEPTIQWPIDKGQKDKQRSTKHTYKTKGRVTRTPLETGDELRCPGKESSETRQHRFPYYTNA